MNSAATLIHSEVQRRNGEPQTGPDRFCVAQLVGGKVEAGRVSSHWPRAAEFRIGFHDIETTHNDAISLPIHDTQDVESETRTLLEWQLISRPTGSIHYDP